MNHEPFTETCQCHGCQITGRFGIVKLLTFLVVSKIIISQGNDYYSFQISAIPTVCLL